MEPDPRRAFPLIRVEKVSLRSAVQVFTPLFLACATTFSGLYRCPSLLLFGLPCPGCGLSRATLAMLRLDVAAMWHFHPLAPVLVPLVGWFLIRIGMERAGWIEGGNRSGRWTAWFLLVLLLGVYGVRAAGGLGGLPDRPSFRDSLFGRFVERVR